MKKFIIAGLLIMGFLLLGCDGNNGKSTSVEDTSSVENNQFDSAAFGRTTFE